MTILIYTIGNRDIQRPDGHLLMDPTNKDHQTFRCNTEAFFNRLENAELRSLLVNNENQCPNQANKESGPEPFSSLNIPFGLKLQKSISLDKPGKIQEHLLYFPIFALCRNYLTAKYGGNQKITIHFVATAQRAKDDGDTVYAAEILKKFAELAYGDTAKIEKIEQGPENHDLMLTWFADNILPKVRQPDQQIYLHITAGTPAMSFAAASTVGVLDHVTSLYTPRPSDTSKPLRSQVFLSTREVKAGKEIARKHTGEVADNALGAQILNPEDLGFYLQNSKSTGLPKPTLKRAQILLSAWEKWERFNHVECGQLLGQVKDDVSLKQLKRHIDLLCKNDSWAPNNTPEFWLARLYDNAMRADIAARKMDTVLILVAMANFKEVSVNYRLARRKGTNRMRYDKGSANAPNTGWKEKIDGGMHAWRNRFQQLEGCYKGKDVEEIKKFSAYCNGNRLNPDSFHEYIAKLPHRKEHIADILEREELGQNSIWYYFPEVFLPGSRRTVSSPPLGNLWKKYNSLKHNTIKVDQALFYEPFFGPPPAAGSDQAWLGPYALAYFLIYMLEVGTEVGAGCYRNYWFDVRNGLMDEIDSERKPHEVPQIRDTLDGHGTLTKVASKIQSWLA